MCSADADAQCIRGAVFVRSLYSFYLPRPPTLYTPSLFPLSWNYAYGLPIFSSPKPTLYLNYIPVPSICFPSAERTTWIVLRTFSFFPDAYSRLSPPPGSANHPPASAAARALAARHLQRPQKQQQCPRQQDPSQ